MARWKQTASVRVSRLAGLGLRKQRVTRGHEVKGRVMGRLWSWWQQLRALWEPGDSCLVCHRLSAELSASLQMLSKRGFVGNLPNTMENV